MAQQRYPAAQWKREHLIVSYFDVSSGHYAIYCSIYNGNEAGAYTDVDSFVNAIY